MWEEWKMLGERVSVVAADYYISFGLGRRSSDLEIGPPLE